MLKNLILTLAALLLLSCSKHELPSTQNPTSPDTQEGEAPLTGAEPTATSTPTPAPTPTISTSPTPPPTPTSLPSPTPTPTADRLEWNGANTASVNDCIPLTLLSKDALGILAVNTDTQIFLQSSGYGSFFTDSNCTLSTASILLSNGQSSAQTYFRSSLGELLTLTAVSTGLASAILTIDIVGTAQLSLQPSSFDFGSVKQNTTATKTFVLTNTGTGVANQLLFTTLAAPYSLASSTCAAELRAQSNCIFDVHFSPTSTGTFSTTLSLGYSSQNNPYTLALSLNGNSLTAGVYDLSFANSGSTTLPYTLSTASLSNDTLYAIKTDSGGNIFAVGNTYNNSSSPGHNDMAVLKFRPDGTLDTSFNSSGKTKVDFGFTDGARSVAVQSDGKIVVGGFAYVSSKFRFGIVRFLANGNLDNTFGTAGKTTTAFANGAQAFAMLLQSSGKSVLAGNAFDSGKNSFALTRYTANGILDSTFGTGGKTTTSFSGSTFETIQALTEDSNQNLIAAGYSNIGGLNKLALAKYTVNGVLVSSFGSSGTLLPSYPGSEATANAIALDTSNHIYIAGKTTTGTSSNLLVMKFLPDGSTDNSFGTLGAIALDLGSQDDEATALSIDSTGKIYVSAMGSNAIVLRLLPSGQLDNTFGTNGKIDADWGMSNSRINTLLLDSFGKILVGGTASNGNNLDFALARFLP